MLFVEARFFFFFAAVFALVWLTRSNEWRKRILTTASYVFYGAWDWRFLGLILLVTLVSYLVGRTAGSGGLDARGRKWALGSGIVFSLAVLGAFKYFNFFADSFADFAGFMGFSAGRVTLDLVLPVGISFYTFQAISYMVDTHRGAIASRRSFLDVGFFLAFFPQLVAGPIVRATEFIPQMDTARRWGDVSVRACVALFLVGFFKKACISDNIAPYVDLIFDNPGAYAASHVIAGVLLYGIQIYCDFSGYSDMAIGCAGLLGYRFATNFNSPYLSPSIKDFWRRWHISLSSWLRDYLYIPLGGSRLGDARRDLNLMTTMVLGGLWHGASFNFVIWGFLHGLALLVERGWNKFVCTRVPAMGWSGAAIGTALTFYWVNLAWIFFRAPDLSGAMQMAGTYVSWQSTGAQMLPIAAWPLIGGLGALHVIASRVRLGERLAELQPNAFALTTGVLAAIALSFVPLGYRPFIYFQF